MTSVYICLNKNCGWWNIPREVIFVNLTVDLFDAPRPICICGLEPVKQ